MKTLVTFFSASGITARIGREFAKTIEADVFEICPRVPYSDADLDWRNPLSRSNMEKLEGKKVPMIGSVPDFGQYDTVYLGFPIWYEVAPNVVYTFCREHNWTGKKVYMFATSGGQHGMGDSAEKLAPFMNGAKVCGAKLVKSAAELLEWRL